MTPQMQRRVLATLTEVEGALSHLSKSAGDAPEWNRGGNGHKAYLGVKSLLDELRDEWGR